MEYKDYYKILGVPKDADADAIKRAFRKLARQYHPDVNKDKKAEERFKEINEANEVLSDPEKRKLYDQLGSNYATFQRGGGDPRAYNWNQWARGAPQGAGGRAGGGDAGFDFSDFFRTFFGGNMDEFGGQSFRQTANLDLEQDVEITLTEAYHGTTRILTKDGRNYEVNIPRGVKTGSKVRVRGQGARDRSGQMGDLYLTIRVMPNSGYERQDNDLHRELRVDAFTAMLGGEVKVDTLAGEVMVKVPAGTSSGKSIRLRGKGMPLLNAKGEFGDLYLRVMVSVPKRLSDEDRWTLDKIAKRYKDEDG